MLQKLYKAVDIKPSFVQNRFIPQTEYEVPQRRFCRARGISFQAIWVLKEKPALLESPLVAQVAASLGNATSKEAALYLLVLGIGSYMNVVTGTEDKNHMEEAVGALSHFQSWVAESSNGTAWTEYVAQFRSLIRESWGFK